MFSVENLAYLAGIIDGEGSIGFEHLAPRAKRPKSYYVCRLTVINTNKDIIDRLKQTFKGTSDIRKPIKNRKVCYRWYVLGNDLEIAIKSLLPYLCIKRKQAELVLEYRQTVRANGWLITDEVAEARKQLWLKCKELNKLG